MIITEPPKPTLFYILSVTAVFFVLGFTALYYAIVILNQLVTEITSDSLILTFDKGAFYLFGVGLGLIVLSATIIYSKIVNNKLPDTIHRLIFISLVASLAVLFILPQAMHFYIDSYTEKNNYQICRDQSHRWLHVVTIVYAKNGRCLDK